MEESGEMTIRGANILQRNCINIFICSLFLFSCSFFGPDLGEDEKDTTPADDPTEVESESLFYPINFKR